MLSRTGLRRVLDMLLERRTALLVVVALSVGSIGVSAWWLLVRPGMGSGSSRTRVTAVASTTGAMRSGGVGPVDVNAAAGSAGASGASTAGLTGLDGAGGSSASSAGAAGSSPSVNAASSGPACGNTGPCPEGFTCAENNTCTRDDQVFIPPGPFRMGCDDKTDDRCEPNEHPVHTVRLSGFAIDRTEVTVADYRACVEQGDCTPPARSLGIGTCTWGRGDGQLPINCVNWEQARKYCGWRVRRLPTEAEWEKAARGTDGRRFPWGNDAPDCDRANIFLGDGSCVDGPWRVGSRAAGESPYGVRDMIGNLLEWVSDYYEPRYYYESPGEDPPGPVTGYLRTLRGASFGEASMRGHQATVRYQLDPQLASALIGFRCAVSVP